jgi:hypothetical protein
MPAHPMHGEDLEDFPRVGGRIMPPLRERERGVQAPEPGSDFHPVLATVLIVFGIWPGEFIRGCNGLRLSPDSPTAIVSGA